MGSSVLWNDSFRYKLKNLYSFCLQKINKNADGKLLSNPFMKIKTRVNNEGCWFIGLPA